jgi:diguanylate cyclase (GGDEF)-like protein
MSNEREIATTVVPQSTPETTETVFERERRRDELKKNLAWFVEHDDMDGLVSFVERMAHFDPLTNTLNRRGFFAEAQHHVDHVARLREGLDRRTGELLTFNVLFLDLDKFKSINDTYGHAAGDAALQKVAEVLRDVLREDDVIGRLGGEEFVVGYMCSSSHGLASRNRFLVAEKVRSAIERCEFEYDGQRIPLTASIGVSQPRPGETDLPSIVRRADEAMYRAKQAGRNSVIVDALMDTQS